jgi:hypothetical protein
METICVDKRLRCFTSAMSLMFAIKNVCFDDDIQILKNDEWYTWLCCFITAAYKRDIINDQTALLFNFHRVTFLFTVIKNEILLWCFPTWHVIFVWKPKLFNSAHDDLQMPPNHQINVVMTILKKRYTSDFNKRITANLWLLFQLPSELCLQPIAIAVVIREVFRSW